MRPQRETGNDARHTGDNDHVLVEGGDVLDVDGLVADIALLLRVVEIDLDIGSGGGGNGGGGGVGGGGMGAVCVGAVDGGGDSELGADGSMDAVWGSVTGVLHDGRVTVTA